MAQQQAAKGHADAPAKVRMIFGIIEPWPAAQWTVWGNFQTFLICMLPTFGKKFVTMTGINITFGEREKSKAWYNFSTIIHDPNMSSESQLKGSLKG